MKTNNSFILRTIQASDAPAIYALSKSAKSGLSNLPKSIQSAELMTQKVAYSFAQKEPKKDLEFLFGIQNHANQLIGISGIKTRVGIHRPYYSFYLNNTVQYPRLELTEQYLGPSEIGRLFLLPEYRNHQIGRLLSLSRFLFVAQFRSFFTSTIIAELRGYLDDNNGSPFWNACGKKFISMPFDDADTASINELDFIEKKFPKAPIYLAFLSKKAISCLGQVHKMTKPAKKLLESEHFKQTNHVDIFDGGPKFECLTNNIRTIKHARKMALHDVPSIQGSDDLLISNTNFKSFRCMKASNQTSPAFIKHALKINKSDPVWVVSERPK